MSDYCMVCSKIAKYKGFGIATFVDEPVSFFLCKKHKSNLDNWDQEGDFHGISYVYGIELIKNLRSGNIKDAHKKWWL